LSADEPLLEAAARIVATALDDLRGALDGLDDAALNWRPAGDGTNSIAVLVTHSMHSTRSWLSVAVGAPLPARERDAEFRAHATAAALRALLDDFGGQCLALLREPATPIDWSTRRATHTRNRAGAADEETAAWALLHALEHLREHTGQITLTRQTWEKLRD